MILISYVIATIIFLVMFLLLILTSNMISKFKFYEKIKNYLFQILFLIPFFILFIFGDIRNRIFNFNNVFDLKNLLLILIGVIPVAILISLKKDKVENLISHVFLGIFMEIPQRLFMQNLFLVLLSELSSNKSFWLPSILNSLIWAQFIIIQENINGKNISKNTIIDILTSIWFSLLIGILYERTGNILLPMIAHGSERFISIMLVKNRSIRYKTI